MVVVATVRAGETRREVQCVMRPSPQQINLLYVLSEWVGRTFTVDDICHRMKISVSSLRYHACRLRQKLDENWTVECETNIGYRLLYIGDDLFAERTVLELRPASLRPRRRSSRLSARRAPGRPSSWRTRL